MEDIAYIRGRLEGLFELVAILREVAHEEEGGKLLPRLVDHVYAELEEILDTLGAQGMKHVEGLKKKIEEGKAERNHRKKVIQSYDVLSELLDREKGE